MYMKFIIGDLKPDLYPPHPKYLYLWMIITPGMCGGIYKSVIVQYYLKTENWLEEFSKFSIQTP